MQAIKHNVKNASFSTGPPSTRQPPVATSGSSASAPPGSTSQATTTPEMLFQAQLEYLSCTNGPYIWHINNPEDPEQGKWIPLSQTQQQTGTPLASGSTLRLISWNIDFSTPLSGIRMQKALQYLSSAESLGEKPEKTVVLLQEIQLPSQHFRSPSLPAGDQANKQQGQKQEDETSLQALLASPWVRRSFSLADLQVGYFQSAGYGCMTLLSRDLKLRVVPLTTAANHQLESCFRVPLPKTALSRDVLVTDIAMVVAGESKSEGGQVEGILRVANVHLESLSGPGTRARPVQLGFVSRLLRATEDGVLAGVVAGDMNAFDAGDVVLPHKCGLGDVWLWNRGTAGGYPECAEDEEEEEARAERYKDLETEEVAYREQLISQHGKAGWLKDPTQGELWGHTWGYQSPTGGFGGRGRFPGRRLDKVCWVDNTKGGPGKKGVIVPKGVVGRVGVGLSVVVEYTAEEKEEMGITEDEEEEQLWVSDHFGLDVKFEVL